MSMGQGRGASDSLFDGSFGIVAAAHELKAPVALIRHLALELEQVDHPTERAELLQQIVLMSERSLRFTSSLTKAARVDEATLFPTEPINAQQLCEEVAHELFGLYAAQERAIRVATRRHPPLVIANRELLRRILLQFGDNALHYTGSRPVTFGVWRQRERVQVGLRDYGLHTAQGTVETGRSHSSGIGLQLAERFAQAMQAHLGVTRHRQGMTFYVDMHASEQLSLL